MNRLTLSLALVLFSVLSFGQTIKFGYTSVDYILAYMPETQTAQAQLQEYENQLTVSIQRKYQTLEQKKADFERNVSIMTDAVRVDKESEILQLQTELQQFQARTEEMMQQKQITLLQPIYAKIQEAINAVAEANGFTHIFNSDALLYAPDGDDVSVLVFRELGVTPPGE